MKILLNIIFLLTVSVTLAACSHSGSTGTGSSSEPDTTTGIDAMNVHMCLMGGGQDCNTILDPENANTYQDTIHGECSKMPGMKACDTYFASINTDNQKVDDNELSEADNEQTEVVDNTSLETTSSETCRKADNGTLVGDCPVDEFGNPYVPVAVKGDDGDDHDDAGSDPHLHDNDHEHADDVPPHRH